MFNAGRPQWMKEQGLSCYQCAWHHCIDEEWDPGVALRDQEVYGITMPAKIGCCHYHAPGTNGFISVWSEYCGCARFRKEPPIFGESL